MSAIALQRVVVRMMHDPAFCKRVYADPERALRDLPLTPQEQQWLVTPPPHAYSADPYRSSRALTGLLEEFPVASALAVRLPRGIPRLQHFFATQGFHQCVQERGSMAAAFGTYLTSEAFRSRKKSPEIAHLAGVETALAHVRRCAFLSAAPAEPVTAETPLRLAPWVVLLTVHADTLRRYHVVLETLQQHGGSLVEAVLDTRYHLPLSTAFQGKAKAFLLIGGLPSHDGPSIEGMTDDLGELLTAAKRPMLLRDLYALAEAGGGEPEEAEEAITGLVDDRILSPCLVCEAR